MKPEHQANTAMDLATDICNWDGKSAKDIRIIYRKFVGQDDFVAELIALTAFPTCQSGATWLLKHHVEQEGNEGLDADDSARLIRQAADFTHWDARLHLLQMLDYMTIPASTTQDLAGLVEICLKDKKTLVRAWGYTGLAQLALTHPDYRQTALKRLEEAMESDSAASAKVRIRRALQRLAS